MLEIYVISYIVFLFMLVFSNQENPFIGSKFWSKVITLILLPLLLVLGTLWGFYKSIRKLITGK